ncbi:hypothetical protein AALP_AA2G161000 [Arabis alpina]|uniref:non-specific serine/threonine protein kinase n=1 Tax=Arabis alpina TaxID=50452 RepID=A0A087HHU2_ARAAL|nr:hypothetical protein AALP_AA2G161000 [Arabis alpina]
MTHGSIAFIFCNTGFRSEFSVFVNPDKCGVTVTKSPTFFSSEVAGFYGGRDGEKFKKLRFNNGDNYQAWIEFNGSAINVTMARAGSMKPIRPLISIPLNLTGLFPDDMFVGFTGAARELVQSQRIISWSFSNSNFSIGDALITRNLPSFQLQDDSVFKSKSFTAGISVSAGVLLLLCVIGFLRFYVVRRRSKGNNEDVEEWETEYWPHRVQYKSVLEATKGFSEENMIGHGGNSKVYKGVLEGKEVAVKRIMIGPRERVPGTSEFLAEVSSLGRLRHKNIVGLKGWCKKGGESLILVYEYMENGSVDKRIFDCNDMLNWEERMRVIKDVASGMLYLHEGWESKVLHRDIKSSNVLLDKDMNAKVGDFGLAKLQNTRKEMVSTTHMVGTAGYMAPDLVKTGRASSQTDVYSFGVFALELVSGRRPIEEGKEGIVEWIWGLMEKDKLLDGLDDKIKAKGEFKTEEVVMALRIGLLCVHPDPRVRPKMRQVVQILEQGRLSDDGGERGREGLEVSLSERVKRSFSLGIASGSNIPKLSDERLPCRLFATDREAFVKTLSSMRPLLQPTSKVADPIGTYCQQLQQHTFRLQGFPLALQLLAYKCIPGLLNKVPNADDGRSFMESSFLGLPKLTSISRNDILEVENADELTVEPLLPLYSSGSEIDGWGEWDDEDRDRKVIYMQDLIRTGHVFEKHDWPGGFAGQGCCSESDKVKCARTVKQKRKTVGLKKGGSKRRQQNLEIYFPPITRTGAQLKDWFESKLEEVRSSLTEKIVEQGAGIAKLKKRKSVVCWSGFGKMSRGAKLSSRKRRKPETINLDSPLAKKGQCSRGENLLSEDEINVDSPLANLRQCSRDEPLELRDGGGTSSPMEEDVLLDDVDIMGKYNPPSGCGKRCYEGEVVAEEDNSGIAEEARELENVCRALDMTVEMVVGSQGDQFEEICDVDNNGEENDVNLGDDEEDYDPELSSITPARTTQRADPVQIELNLVKQFSLKKKRDGTDLLPTLDPAEFAFFVATLKACPHIECVTSEGLSLNSQFLLDLAQPAGLVSTTHMEVLMAFFRGRHAATLVTEKCLFASLWFVSYLQGKYASFEKAINKKQVKWSDRMIRLVTEECSTWFEDIDIVYVPMCWESVHWVGVAIHLKIWSVEVYDLAPSLYSESQMLELMGPITKMLLHIVTKYCPGAESQNNGVKLLGYRHVEGIYESTHSDELGPVAVKFLEFELCGNPGEGMAFIRDDVVADLRKQFAMDIFHEWFVPFYPNLQDAV